LLQLQRRYGNRYVQRVLAQARKGKGRASASPEAEQAIQRKQRARRKRKRRVDYTKAKRLNERFVEKLGSRLAEIQPAWAKLWNNGEFDQFANVVAAFQARQGFKGRRVNGILNSRTWDRLRPVGEVIAGQWALTKKVVKMACTIATRKRLVRGYRRATGKRLIPRRRKRIFDIILQSNPKEMHLLKDTPYELYQATGAAGALAYLGKGDIIYRGVWEGKKLKPGAAMQVWKTRDDFGLVRSGRAPLKETRWRGTSFVFVRYVGDGAMLVLHGGRLKPQKIGRYEYGVWIGANLRE